MLAVPTVFPYVQVAVPRLDERALTPGAIGTDHRSGRRSRAHLTVGRCQRVWMADRVII